MPLSTPAQAVVDRVTAKRSGTGDVPHDPDTDRLVLLSEVVKKLDAGGGGGSGDYLPLAGGTMNESAEITFTNNSRIRQTPGANGLDLVCSIEYVHRWKEGSLYILDTANSIRVVMYGIATPDSSFDFTQGYTIGSRVIKDDGTTYVCTDSTEAAAVWTQIEKSIVSVNSITLTDLDNGRVIFSEFDGPSESWVYLDGNKFPADGFSCSIVGLTTNTKIGVMNGATISGPGMVTGNWVINDAVNLGVGMGATIVVRNSAAKQAHIIGSVEATA